MKKPAIRVYMYVGRGTTCTRLALEQCTCICDVHRNGGVVIRGWIRDRKGTGRGGVGTYSRTD